jgi:hypothetical protein
MKTFTDRATLGSACLDRELARRRGGWRCNKGATALSCGGARQLGSGGGIELGVGLQRPLPRPWVRGRWGRKGRVDREAVDDGSQILNRRWRDGMCDT